jgi:tRNA-modifying protein YgfZ
MRALPLEKEVEALEEGRGYAELETVALTLVSGSDARGWLNDLVTTDVQSLGLFETRPSLLLSPTGRIRASFHVLALGERDFALAQPVDQPESVSHTLAPYVLSSDVAVSLSRLRLFAVPGGTAPPRRFGNAYRPSVLGGDGYDLLVGASDEEVFEDLREDLAAEGLLRVGRDAIEARRIRRGEALFPADLDTESLPAEAALDAAPVTDRTKGCFLGQEAVAKVANLGHPTRVILPVEAAGPVFAGERIRTEGGKDAGLVTSVIDRLGIVRIRWDARDADLATASGTRLRLR